MSQDTDTQELDGDLVGKNIKKIAVSKDWNDQERASLRNLFAQELARLKLYAQQMRKTCLWEAPYFRENVIKQLELEQMDAILVSQRSEFLQANRENFSDYIQ